MTVTQFESGSFAFVNMVDTHFIIVCITIEQQSPSQHSIIIDIVTTHFHSKRLLCAEKVLKKQINSAFRHLLNYSSINRCMQVVVPEICTNYLNFLAKILLFLSTKFS